MEEIIRKRIEELKARQDKVTGDMWAYYQGRISEAEATLFIVDGYNEK